MIDFNNMSTHLRLFYALKLGNCIHCMFTFFCIVLKKCFFCTWSYQIPIIFKLIYLTHRWDLNWHSTLWVRVDLVGRNTCGVMAKVLDCGLKIFEFKLHLRCYIPFRTHTLGKGMNPFIPLAITIFYIVLKL